MSNPVCSQTDKGCKIVPEQVGMEVVPDPTGPTVDIEDDQYTRWYMRPPLFPPARSAPAQVSAFCKSLPVAPGSAAGCERPDDNASSNGTPTPPQLDLYRVAQKRPIPMPRSVSDTRLIKSSFSIQSACSPIRIPLWLTPRLSTPWKNRQA